MITAQEAYDLACPNLGKHLDYLEKLIREAAERGETYVRISKEPYASFPIAAWK